MHRPLMSLAQDEWIESWRLNGRAYRFSQMESMKFLAYGSIRGQGVTLSEKIQWYVVDSGNLAVGVGVPTLPFTHSLKKLTASKR